MTAKEWLGVMQQASNFPKGMEKLIIKYGEMLIDEKNITKLNLNQLKDKATKFSDRTFGSNRNPALLINKLKEEVDELQEHLTNKKDPALEFADCFLILIDAYRMHYGNNVDMQKLINDSSDKLDICETRTWGEPDKFGNFKHIK